MDSETNAFHEHVVDIGKKLGLRTEREASLSHSGTAYAPRRDILWMRPLAVAQRKAIEEVRACPQCTETPSGSRHGRSKGRMHRPGGCRQTLRTMRVFGAPFGFLAVRGGTKDNLYERACRLTRTQRHHFGDQAVVPLDTSWLSELAQLTLSPRVTSWPAKTVKGGGGEGKWAESVRTKLCVLGEQVGFDVFDSFKALLPSHMELTRSEMDVVWTLPMLELRLCGWGRTKPICENHG